MVSEPYKIIEKDVEPTVIAQEFIMHELIKIFPNQPEYFYDVIRSGVINYRKYYRDDRFWRLVEGFSDYMLKGYYRLLKGTKYTFNLEEVPLENLSIRLFGGPLGEIVSKGENNAAKAGKLLREMPLEKRDKLLDPFKLSEDNVPIFVEETDDELLVHDGNRRSLDAATFGMETIRGYVARKRKPPGKNAIPEVFLADLTRIMRDADEVSDQLVQSLCIVLIEFKKTYADGPSLVDFYTKQYVIPFVKNEHQKEMSKKVLEYKVV